MQFTVIIEFLMPGLAALLLGLALLPSGAIPQLLQTPFQETAKALLLLAVAYPVGHLVNFPVYVLLQQKLLTARARRRTFNKYKANDIELDELASGCLWLSGIEKAKKFSGASDKDLKRLFEYMQVIVETKNITLRNSEYLYHQGLQRLARGMFIPILMASLLIWRRAGPAWISLEIFFGVFLVVCLALLIHSLRKEEDRVAEFFIALYTPQEALTANQGLKRTADAAA